ncbi:RNA polymerase sigma factor [Amycolatopsis sp. CA-126428]|uniref:RNA polymerase sigma factor n=1 Tax=Amycolatopsis sp. CA-126428 TaxID=2073158 RepID=UPI001E439F8C|nr:sigma-70 family RNA polymerase sigma factor [Amycolatopsis sp. CA-126428]
MSPLEIDLVRSAQAGSASALGMLLARHQAGIRVVALSILGHGPDAEDAVQDVVLIALRRIGTLRDPAAAGPWLHAIDRLSPALRQVVLLRHFSDVTSYEQIAAACELPVGTVRSRLNQARAKPAEALLAAADEAYDDAAARNAAGAREATDTLAAARRGEFAAVVADRWSPGLHMTSGQGYRGGVEMAVRGMDADLGSGVRQKFVHAVTSRDCTVWEMEMISPAHDPHHCPPAVVWLMSHPAGRVERLRLFFPVVSAGRTAGSPAG